MIRKILSVLVAAACLAAAGPQIKVDNADFDGGSVAEGTKLKAVFRLTNTGNQPLKITSVRPDCGCTVVKYDSVIAPGKTSVLEPVVDLKGRRPGHISRGVTITSNASNTPTLNLTISATIVSPVDVSESYLSFENGEKKTVYLSSSKKDLKVSGITFNPHGGGQNTPGWAANIPLNVSYKFAATDSVSADGRKVYRLDIDSPTAGTEQNPVAGSFQISTNHSDKKEIIINGRAQ